MSRPGRWYSLVSWASGVTAAFCFLGCGSDAIRPIADSTATKHAPPAAILVEAGASQVIPAGMPLDSIIVTVENASADPVAGVRLGVYRTDSTSLPALAHATTDTAGRAVFVGAIAPRATGAYTLQIRPDSASSPVASVSATVVPVPASILGSPPGFAYATQRLVGVPLVTVQDSSRHPIVGIKVVFSVDSGGGSVEGPIAYTDMYGGAKPTAWILGPAVTPNVIRATAAGLSTTISQNVISGPPATITVTRGNNPQVGVGLAIPPDDILIRVVDVLGGVVPYVVVSWSRLASDTTHCSATTDNNGIGSFPYQCQLRVGPTPGVYSFDIAAGSAHGTLTATALEIPLAPQFVAGPAANSVVAHGGPTQDVTIQLRLTSGAPAAGYRVTFKESGYVAAPVDTATTDANGRATDHWAPIGNLGPDSLVVRVVAVPGLSAALPVTLSGPVSFLSLAAGGAHTCGIDHEALLISAFCWGSNVHGQLGDGTAVPRRLNPAKAAISATDPVLGSYLDALTTGGDHTCLNRPHGEIEYVGHFFAPIIYCWGANAAGQLGTASLSDAATPTPVQAPALRTGTQVYNPSAGAMHTCAVRVTDSLFWAGWHSFETLAFNGGWCWGDNRYGQLGDGTTSSRATPVAVDTSLTGRAITAVAAGNAFSCALTERGAAYCWGLNDRGQLGDGTTTNRSRPVAVAASINFAGGAIVAGDAHACARTSAGAVYCWGANESGQLGDGSMTMHASPVTVAGGMFASLSAGGSHTCAVAASGAAYCWGSNTYGELGTGNGVGAASTPQLVAGGHAFGSITAGRNHTCGLLSVPQFSGAAAYCWGLNADGQLGDGTTINRAAPVAVGPYTP